MIIDSFTKIFSIALLLIPGLLLGCGGSSKGDGVFTLDVAGPECENSTQQKVLFIGNSYTYYNELPSLFKAMACDAGYNLAVTTAAKANYDFSDHLNDSSTLSAIDSEQWDFVILQNHSLALSYPPDEFVRTRLPIAVALAEAINQNNPATRIIYYVTQGRENGDSLNCPSYSLVCTFAGHTEAINTGYQIYQDSTGGQLALASNAWKAVVDDASAPFDSGELWQSDVNNHPELLGSYLTACVLFATIFNQSPVGLAVPEGVSVVNAEYVQQVAAGTVGL